MNKRLLGAGIFSTSALVVFLVVLSFAAPVSATEMIGGDQSWYVGPL
jgi:hypothetical protein